MNYCFKEAQSMLPHSGLDWGHGPMHGQGSPYLWPLDLPGRIVAADCSYDTGAAPCLTRCSQYRQGLCRHTTFTVKHNAKANQEAPTSKEDRWTVSTSEALSIGSAGKDSEYWRQPMKCMLWRQIDVFVAYKGWKHRCE